MNESPPLAHQLKGGGSLYTGGKTQNIHLCVSLCTLTALSTESYFAQNYTMDGVVEWMRCKWLGPSN